MDDLIDILESFNRKERFFLISHALNGRRENPAFTLSESFRQELAKAVGLDRQGIEIPACAFAAMDYHLDWVAASVAVMDREQSLDGVFPNPGQKLVEGGPKDIDLLVAFGYLGKYHLMFVGAKAYGNWDNDQMSGKAARLKLIFGDDGGNIPT